MSAIQWKFSMTGTTTGGKIAAAHTTVGIFVAPTPGDLPLAAKLRRQWMGEMGLSDEEIAESLEEDPPTSIAAERQQLDALRAVQQITPPSAVLQGYADKGRLGRSNGN